MGAVISAIMAVVAWVRKWIRHMVRRRRVLRTYEEAEGVAGAAAPGAPFTTTVTDARADQLERALEMKRGIVEGLQTAGERDEDPELWAFANVWLGLALWLRAKGDRALNLREAAACFEAGLTVFTQSRDAVHWAASYSNLGMVWRELGESRKALECCNKALEVNTRSANEEDWASGHSNAGLALCDLDDEDRSEHLEEAIRRFNLALEVRTRDDYPELWALTASHLGTAYMLRIEGDRRENADEAIALLNSVLATRSYESQPLLWADVQFHLATAHVMRASAVDAQGSADDRQVRADDLDAAIRHYEGSLRVYSLERFPLQCIAAHENLASAYENRLNGDRAHNIQSCTEHRDFVAAARRTADLD